MAFKLKRRTVRQRISQTADRNRFAGCLVGGAVGDALGAPVEFMSSAEIARQFGKDGVREFLPAYGRVGAITDDTQMTLFTAEGLIRGYVRLCNRGIGPSFVATVGHAYSRWLMTQGSKPGAGVVEDYMGWLYGQKALHHRRAPGATCLSALQGNANWEDKARNDSKGCGGVMRAAPVGLLCWHMNGTSEEVLGEAFRLGCDIAALTHGHPSGFLPAGVLAGVVLLILDGLTVREALARVKAKLRATSKHEETLLAIEKAEELSQSASIPSLQAIHSLGGGWVGEEALAIGLYCALRASSFEEGVIMAVSHGGDSDSTGSIAGNILGALMGGNSIPERWLERLELRGVIEEVAIDMTQMVDWELGEFGGKDYERVYAKYPPN